MNFYQQKYFKPYHEIVSPYRQPIYHTPSTHKYGQKAHIHYSDKISQPIWQHLYNEGLKSKQSLLNRHELTKHKIDIECTFKPLIKQNKRYRPPSHSNFIQRNNMWLQNKIQKIVKQKQQQINKDLKQCTFKPKINPLSKRAHPDQYEYKIHKKTCPNQHMHKSAIKIRRPLDEENQELSPRRKANYVEIGKAKQMIRNQLKRLVL